MGLYLEVIQGTSVGSQFAIKEGCRLGRTAGEIIIPDRKISSIHAKIEKQGDRLVLIDMESANGLVISNQKVKSIVLMPGVIFKVGKTIFRVLEGDGDSELTQSPRQSTDIPDQVAHSGNFHSENAQEINEEGPPIFSLQNEKTWKEVLQEQVPLISINNRKEENHTLQPFSPAVRLDFVRGPEHDRHLILGYGPRKFGTEILDIELRDPHAPAFAFELIPEGKSVRIVSHSKDLVLLNGKSFTEAYLYEDDQIEVGQTQIRFSHHTQVAAKDK